MYSYCGKMVKSNVEKTESSPRAYIAALGIF